MFEIFQKNRKTKYKNRTKINTRGRKNEQK